MTRVPSREVLDAFGATGRPVPLRGGEGVTFRAGDIVLKRVHDAAEAAWVQALLASIDQDGFRVPPPVSTLAGGWVHDGWSASRFIEELSSAQPGWDDIAEWGLRFSDAATRSRPRDVHVLHRRSHRWAIADRAAWEEQAVGLTHEAEEIRQDLSALLIAGRSAEDDVIHGDLSGNVFLDASGEPVILDVSPYLRPRRWASAIVVADAVLWHGADLSMAQRWAHQPEDLDLLARALIFRLVAEQLAEHPRHGAVLEPYELAHRALA